MSCSEDLKKINIVVWGGYIDVVCPHCSREFFRVPCRPVIKTGRCCIYKNFIGTKGKKVVVEISESGHVHVKK